MAYGDITDEDRRRWQSDAHRALGDFLADAVDNDLPAINWTIAVSGSLVGDVDSLTVEPGRMREVFNAWRDYLDVKSAERTSSDGTIHLYAKFRWVRDDLVGGAIRATIVPPMDDEAVTR